MQKPYSEAANRNKDPILDVLKKYINSGKLFEVGSGTAQHCVYFASYFSNLTWVASDRPEYHEGINAWLYEANLSNVEGPIKFVIGEDTFPNQTFDYVYSSNTLHIMSWKECLIFFDLLGDNLKRDAYIFFYGPFNYDGQFTSESNFAFDQMLRARDPNSGIRDFSDIKYILESKGFEFINDHKMPANNRLLVFKR